MVKVSLGSVYGQFRVSLRPVYGYFWGSLGLGPNLIDRKFDGPGFDTGAKLILILKIRTLLAQTSTTGSWCRAPSVRWRSSSRSWPRRTWPHWRSSLPKFRTRWPRARDGREHPGVNKKKLFVFFFFFNQFVLDFWLFKYQFCFRFFVLKYLFCWKLNNY